MNSSLSQDPTGVLLMQLCDSTSTTDSYKFIADDDRHKSTERFKC